MRWPKRIRWPWRRRTRPSAPKRTAEALRNLYFDYLKQKRMWGYSVISSMMLMCLFISMSLFADTNFWVLAIPVTAIVFSFFQMRRCTSIVRVLRHTLTVQQQIDRAQAQAEREAAEAQQAAAEAEEAELPGLPTEGPADRNGPSIDSDGPFEEAE